VSTAASGRRRQMLQSILTTLSATTSVEVAHDKGPLYIGSVMARPFIYGIHESSGAVMVLRGPGFVGILADIHAPVALMIP
jgi:hypothetical protein